MVTAHWSLWASEKSSATTVIRKSIATTNPKGNMTSPNDQKLQQKAAEALEDLSARVDQGYAEISRCYEILSVLHGVALMYLDSEPVGATEEENEAVDTVRDAVRAL